MALTSQIDAAARQRRRPIGLLVFDRQVTVASTREPDEEARRRFAIRLCKAAIRHKCTANEPNQGDQCTNPLHKRDQEAARMALILAGLAPDPYPSVERERKVSPEPAKPSFEVRRAMQRREREAAQPSTPSRDLSWMDNAACRTADVNLFFPRDGERKTEREVREAHAKAVCDACPVRRPCFETALERREEGVWGQSTEEERVTVRRRRGVRAKRAAA